jgi:hypothetical protein
MTKLSKEQSIQNQKDLLTLYVPNADSTVMKSAMLYIQMLLLTNVKFLIIKFVLNVDVCHFSTKNSIMIMNKYKKMLLIIYFQLWKFVIFYKIKITKNKVK